MKNEDDDDLYDENTNTIEYDDVQAEQRDIEILPIRRRKQEPPKKKNTGKLAIITIIIMAMAAAAYLQKDKIKEFFAGLNTSQLETSEKTAGKTKENPIIKLENGNRASFVSYGKDYLYCTKDGVKFFDSEQNQKWNYTYTMSSPIAVNNEKFTAIAEVQGRTIRMYNETGEIYTVQTDGSIFQFAVNKIGGMSVIVKGTLGYKVLVYNQTGQLLMERFEQDAGIYPIASDISDDGRVLGVSYLDTTGIEMVSKMLLFYTNKEETKNTDSGEFFASAESQDEVVAAVNYMDNGNFVWVSDKSAYVLDLSGNEKDWNEAFTNEVDGVAFGGGKNVVIAFGKAFAGSADSVEEGTVKIINSSGKTIGKYAMGVPVSYLKAYSDGIVVGGNKEFACLDYNGKVKWQYSATQDIKDIVLMKDSKNVLLVGNGEAEFIKME